MLSSQFENLILEYKQDITVKKMGEPLVARFLEDAQLNPNILSPQTKKIVDALVKTEERLIHAPNPEGATPEDLAKIEAEKEKLKEKSFILKNQLAVEILGRLEDADPTPNKNYVQWLARTYINNDDSFEDVESTTADFLDKFHRLKIKHHLDNNDIGQYKDFNTFMDDMAKYPNDLIDDDQGKKKKYNADIIYDEKGILIVRPNDVEASCRYGRGTRWCTAATKGNNYFDSYTSKGPLYMFMPRKPNHPGEKYQFHFENGVVADETDSYLSQNQKIKLANDYPALKDAFQKQAEKFGLIWLQKPKRVHKGSNFNVEEYRKNDNPYYLMKPTDKTDQIYGMENTDDGMKIFNLSDSGSYNTGEMNTIQEHDLFNDYPELVTKFGVKGANLQSDPIVTDTKNKAKIEQHGNIIVMTDQHGHKTSIIRINNKDRWNGAPGPLEIEASRTSPFKDEADEGKLSKRYHTLNPYELTLEHPELVELYGPTVQKYAKEAKKKLKDFGADPKEQKEYYQEALRKVAGYLPYKLYNQGNVQIKSHMTSDGKPVRDYITNNEKGTATIINRNITTGEVDSIQPVDIERVGRISKNDSHTLHNTQGELYGDAEMQPELQRLYSIPDDREDKALDFLPSISFLEQNPELKDFYKDTNLVKPKVKEYPTNIIRDYGKVVVPDGQKSHGRYNSIVKDVKSMRNYIVTPKDAKDGESYAIGWSPEQPMYVEIYHSDANGNQTQLVKHEEAHHVLKKFPELRNLHEKDYINFIDGTDREPKRYSSAEYHSGDVTRSGVPEYLFNPTEETINDRVEVLQYGPNEGATHELPKFEVRPKEKNPFGELGDTFFVNLTLRDNRSDYGKIGKIDITRLRNNLYKSEPVDQHGNYKDDSSPNRDFEPVDTKIRKQRSALSSKEVVDFFKYYPELRRMIRDENIHPKVPHPAIAVKPDEEGNVETNSVQMDNFTLEDTPSISPEVEKQYIIPNQPEYEGEFYTLFTYDPQKETASKNGKPTINDWGNLTVFNDRGITQLVQGEIEKQRHMNTTREELTRAFTAGASGTITPNTPAYNKLMQRLPDLKELISEKSAEIGDYRTQNISEDDVIELGTERVYTFKNRDGSDLYIITPVGNPLRGEHGEIKQAHRDSDHSRGRMGNDVGYTVRQLASDETDWEADEEVWNKDAFAVNFDSTENNPHLAVNLLIDPFASIIDLQLMDKKLDDANLVSTKQDFSAIGVNNMPTGGIETFMEGTYLGKAKKNPELYRWLKEKAEQRNAETKGIGDFINFLDVTSEQMTDEQRSVPKVYGIDIVGIAKIGISNPLYMWQGRRAAFERAERKFTSPEEMATKRYSQHNEEYKERLKDINIDVSTDNNWTTITDTTIIVKPESDTKFGNIGSNNKQSSIFVQVPYSKFVNMGSKLANADKIIPKKNLKAMGAIPTKTWGPRQVAALAPSSKLTNNGKPWIKSIQEFKMPDGLGIDNSSGMPDKILPPGTGYMITLNPISEEDGKKKRVDGKLVRQRSPWSTMMSVFRETGIDLPWEFESGILNYGKKENKMLIYFANNRVAYIMDPTYYNSGNFKKFNLKQDAKKALFFDEEYGLFPQLKPIFDEYTKSNKWLRENQIHAIMSKIIFEGLGDKAYYELQKKKSKPNYGQLVFLNNIRLTGSYSNEQLKAMGFFMKNGSWAIQKPKYDRLVGDGKLKEMISRPLKTGTNRIPKVGKKKVNEGKKLPRTSEFLYQKVDEVEDIKRLSGVYDNYQIPVYVEGATSAYSGSNISKTAAEIAKIMKEKNIQPGTPEWFQLWFSLPKMTGEKPTGKE